MHIEFTIVGEHRDDTSQFIVVDADGQYYCYDPAREQVRPTDLDDQWDLRASGEQGSTDDGWQHIR